MPKFIPTATFSTQQPLLPSETTAELTKKTRNLQDDSFVRLERTTQTLDDTIHLGTDTTHKLRRQGEQLTALTPHLEAASMNVKTANKQTRRLLKLLACDRVSVILFLLILILVGAIIALLVLQAQGKIVLPL